MEIGESFGSMRLRVQSQCLAWQDGVCGTGFHTDMHHGAYSMQTGLSDCHSPPKDCVRFVFLLLLIFIHVEGVRNLTLDNIGSVEMAQCVPVSLLPEEGR